MTGFSAIRRLAMKVVLPIASVVPAALFGALWKWLNSTFLPFIGEGYDGPASCLSAGIIFYLSIALPLHLQLKDKGGDALRAPQLRQVYAYLLAVAVGIPTGRILFSILPPWDNAIGAILGAVVSYSIALSILKEGRGRFVHARGTVKLNAAEGLKLIQKLPVGTEPRIRWAGYDLPGEVAIGNFLSVGAIGTGKTRMHRALMQSVLPHIRPNSDRRALIYDVKSDLLSELGTMGLNCDVLVFNPFDSRSVAWAIASDIRTPEHSRHFVEALKPDAVGEENPFFTTGARNVIAGCIDALNRRCPGNWTLRDLVRVTATRPRLEQLLAGTDLSAQYFSPPNTFDNIRNTIANVTVPLEPIAALWEHATHKVSLKQWVKTGDSILVLGGKENLQASLEPLNRVAFNIITTEFLSEPESPVYSRLWFFCDELKTAGRLEKLPAILNARSKGVRAVLGFQDIEGLIDAYGSQERAKELSGRCATISWLKVTSTDTAEWASKRSGEFERFEYFDTQTKDGTNVGEHLTKREAILPSEFLNLPDFRSGKASGFHLIRGVTGVIESAAQYAIPKTDRMEDFQPRDDGEQVLTPWTDADAERLGLNEGSPTNKNAAVDSRPNETPLKSLGRVTL